MRYLSRKPRSLLFISVSIILFLFLLSFVQAKTLPKIYVLAPKSIAYPLNNIVRDYAQKHNVIINVFYDNIENNIEKLRKLTIASVIITEHPKDMKLLIKSNSVHNYLLQAIATNELVVISDIKEAYKFRNIKKYTAKMLINLLKKENYGLLLSNSNENVNLYITDLISRVKNSNVTKEKLIYINNFNVVNNIIDSSDRIGISYYSTVYDNPNIYIIASLNEDLYTAIKYQSIISKQGENLSMVKDLNKFLSSKTAKNIFKKYGFVEK